MNEGRRFNWPLWSGLALSIFALLSDIFVFVRYPITRDVPWVGFLLSASAIALLIAGYRRAHRKIVASIVVFLGVAVTLLFCFGALVATKLLPPSLHAPKVGEKAPDFVLSDAGGRTVALSQLLAAPGARGVMLVFYRGWW